MPAKPSSPERRLVELWLCLRIFTMFIAAVFGPIRPGTDREIATPAWPPAAPFLRWFERAFLAPWERWDAARFADIVRSGYHSGDGSTAFHPLFQWLARPIFWITGEPIVGLWLVASVFSLLAVLAVYRLARLDLPEDQSELACKFLLAFPIAAILFAPYTESLWIASAAMCFWYMRQNRWLLAGAAAGVATLTRQQGIFLLVPLAWELIETRTRNWRSWAPLLLAPASYLGWVVYRTVAVGEGGTPDFTSIQSLIYSTLLSPASSKVVRVQAMLLPTDAIWRAVVISWNSPTLNNTVDLVLGALFLVMTAAAWKCMRGSYRAFTCVILLASFALYTGPMKPYMGLPRHLMLAIPVFIGLAPVVAKGARRNLAAPLFVGVIFVTVVYVLHAWVP